MSGANGKRLVGLDHLRQSIIDILTTRIGTRVMRRDYGSAIPDLIDRPVNEDFGVDLFVALAEALLKWEPRLRLRESSFVPLGDGGVELNLSGDYLPDGREIKLAGLVVR